MNMEKEDKEVQPLKGQTLKRSKPFKVKKWKKEARRYHRYRQEIKQSVHCKKITNVIHYKKRTHAIQLFCPK